jgi:micrococcal nuclease
MVRIRRILIPITSLAVIIVLGVCHGLSASKFHTVVTVFDGDTIELDDGRKVRLIGVDAPEVESPYRKRESFGDESKAYLSALILKKKISLVVGDPQKDRYGRTLAYVYIGDILVNGRIIRDGWAFAYRKFHHQWSDLFLVYEREARSRGIGMFKEKRVSRRAGSTACRAPAR